ncbi:MAG: hypothetical protein QOE39_2686 [Bradyrhizobium sp.]|jgi:hypothetical protein|nr:hypothetical protein [Bradyrhizobium sp.]
MKRTTVIAAVAGFGLGGLAGVLSFFAWPMLDRGSAGATPSHPVWAEVQWPYPTDEWGTGKAFRCGAADCGAEVNLYIRAKIGFCNCKTGVSDDDELARLSDFRLMGEKLSVLGPGRPINVAWMKGRSRAYAIADPYRVRNSALAVAFNDHCDAVVATVVVAQDHPGTIEPSVIEFLNSETIVRWAEVTLGL